MDKQVKNEWLAALRDGSYKQGRFQLRDMEDHFDPIGVLMDRAVAAGVIGEPRFFGPGRDAPVFFGWTYDGSATRLTRPVEQWSGLNYWTANHILSIYDKGMTFEDIADYIEENL